MLSVLVFLPSLHAPALRTGPNAVRMVATFSPTFSPALSGLNGAALGVTLDDIPSLKDIRRAVPARCFTRQTGTSLRYLGQSLIVQAGLVALGRAIPLSRAMLPVWIAYACVSGTAATGLWVLAHECGHGAFSDNRRLQTAVGFSLHSALLVPYFSWQRSHAVHHANTNHISDGETHVPLVVGGDGVAEHAGGQADLATSRSMGKSAYGALQLALHLIFGWPAYLLFGKTGGPTHGVSNHFWPTAPFSNALWPASGQRRRARQIPAPIFSLQFSGGGSVWGRGSIVAACGRGSVAAGCLPCQTGLPRTTASATPRPTVGRPSAGARLTVPARDSLRSGGAAPHPLPNPGSQAR